MSILVPPKCLASLRLRWPPGTYSRTRHWPSQALHSFFLGNSVFFGARHLLAGLLESDLVLQSLLLFLGHPLHRFQDHGIYPDRHIVTAKVLWCRRHISQEVRSARTIHIRLAIEASHCYGPVAIMTGHKSRSENCRFIMSATMDLVKLPVALLACAVTVGDDTAGATILERLLCSGGGAAGGAELG